MTNILLPSNINFCSTRAMELAQLIELAYQHYDCQQAGKSWKPEQIEKLIGSNVYLEESNLLDQEEDLDDLPGKIQYKILNFFKFTGFWWTRPETVPFGFIVKRLPEPPTEDREEIFVVFRGTRELQEWYRNFDFAQEAFLDDDDFGRVSKGFQTIYTRAIKNKKDGNGKNIGYLNEYRIISKNQQNNEIKFDYEEDNGLSWSLLKKIRKIEGEDRAIAEVVGKTLLDNCPQKNCKVFVTGHSLGGALATLAAGHIKLLGYKDVELYTFASPRVGNQKFAKSFQDMNCYRIANSEDIVTNIPYSTDRVIGDEMLDQGMTEERRNTVNFLEKLLDSLLTKIFEETYQHIGTPLYFTYQSGAVSTNHNMFLTYRGAIFQYKSIENYKQNTNSSGEISQQDKYEILSLLNSNKYQARVPPNGFIEPSVIDKIGEEIETEITEKKLDFGYLDNCHTWAKKVHKKIGLDIVRGYLYKPSEFGHDKLTLTAHSVVKDQSGKLVELTMSFPPCCYLFIEHNSGEYGIDLIAQK